MKKIMIFNGNPEAGNVTFENYISMLSKSLENLGNKVSVVTLRDANLNYCVGCFNCWIKTPGVCVFKDDGPRLLKEYMHSDKIVFTSPIIMGFISPLLKNVNERMFAPIMHPFLKIINDRMQHLMRYDKYPVSCLLLENSDKYNQDNIDLIHDIYKSARHRMLLFTKVMNNNVEEAAYEINNI